MTFYVSLYTIETGQGGQPFSESDPYSNAEGNLND